MDTTTIAKTEKGIKGRCERGIALYAAGAVSRHGDLYVVRGTRRAYTVCLEHPTMGETCDCPDHREQGRTCKHIVGATIFKARERCRPTARPKTGTRR